MEAWLFLNHLSLMMEYDALSQIYLNGKEKNVSFEDLRQALQKVKAVKLDGKWIPSVRRKKIAEIVDAVSFNPWIISLPIQQPKDWKLQIKTGSQLAIFSDGENIILKPIELPTESKLLEALSSARAYAEKEELSSDDVEAAIKESRKAREDIDENCNWHERLHIFWSSPDWQKD